MSQNLDTAALIEQGKQQLDKGDYAAALETFQQATAEAPQNHEVLYGLGLACYRLERYEQAVGYLNQALEVKPNSILALVRRGMAYRKLKKTQQAEADFQEAIGLTPESVDDWRGRGIALDDLGRYQEAVVCYDKAIEIKPDDYITWYNRGNALNDLERYEDAVADFDKAIEIKPDDYYAWFYRGYALYNLERYEDAVTSYDRAIEIKPDDYNAWFYRGYALYNLERDEDAVADFNKAIEIKPDEYDALFYRGNALGNLRRYEEAIVDFDEVIEIKPDDYIALLYRGNALGNLRRYEEAIVDFDKVIEIKPNEYYALLCRGSALSCLGRYEDAVASYDKAIEIKPNEYDAWYKRGIGLGYLGRYEDAVADFNKAIEIKPDEYNIFLNRGIALYNLERNEDAIADFNKAIEIKPDDYNAWYNRGIALRNLERYEDAVASYDKAIEIKPDDSEAWFRRGIILCDSLQQYKNAIASFDEALRLTNYQYWLAWNNRGVALFKSQGYKAAIKTWDDGIKALKPENPDYEEGCGNLYREKGKALNIYATKESEPFSNWLAAKGSYEKALNFLTFEKFPQRHLQILQELLQVCSTLGDESAFQKYIEAAAQRLEKMVAECDTQGKKITLERRYAAFNQLRVDIKLQSKDADKEIAALELAEKRKNTCLGWLQESWDYQPPKITDQDMQKLLNPKTAAVFWHISPNAITTFIVKHNQPPIVLSPQSSKKQRKQNIFSFNSFFGNSQHSELSKAYLEQLQSFQSWINEWKQDYQDYCQEDFIDTTKKTAPWRLKMKGLLDGLGSILEINRITEHLGGIKEVILIPHRELHLLPLDYLFPPRFNITYLPSFQIGLKLLAQAPVIKQPVSQILNVTDDNLVFNAIESIILNTIYPSCKKLEVQTVTQKSLTTALQKNSGYFHFSGHGYHVPDNPRDSALALAESEKLTLGDIFDNEQLNLSKYELICLSACETGITSNYSLVDEYVGLASGFLAKGATYVLSTLWTVDERSTALLMIQFYQLMQQGNTPTIALKQAKKWLSQLTYKQLAEWYANLSEKLHDSQCREYLKTEVSIIQNDKVKMTSIEQIYVHPYYWAGFILTGKV